MSETKLNTIIDAILEKKGFDVVSINIGEISTFADYFVICSGASTVQTKAIYENIYRKLKKQYKIIGIEGNNNGYWILMDYGDIIIHIFHKDTREKYSLELLWADGKIVKYDGEENAN